MEEASVSIDIDRASALWGALAQSQLQNIRTLKLLFQKCLYYPASATLLGGSRALQKSVGRFERGDCRTSGEVGTFRQRLG